MRVHGDCKVMVSNLIEFAAHKVFSEYVSLGHVMQNSF